MSIVLECHEKELPRNEQTGFQLLTVPSIFIRGFGIFLVLGSCVPGADIVPFPLLLAWAVTVCEMPALLLWICHPVVRGDGMIQVDWLRKQGNRSVEQTAVARRRI